VSEQHAEQTHGEPGSVSAGSTTFPSSEPSSEAAAAADLAVSVLRSPAIAPDHEAPPRMDEAKAGEVKAGEVKADLNAESSRIGVPKPAACGTGKVLIMAPSDRAWHDHSADVKVEAEEARSGSNAAPNGISNGNSKDSSKRGFGAMAAMLVLATIAGAIGGALATTGLTHVADAAATTPASGALENSIARIDSDIVALKAGLEHASKTGVSQFNKTNDRLDKIEKAQAEPNARLAKLTEAVDKLRAVPPAVVAPAQAAAVPVAPKEVTGSVTPPAVTAAVPAQTTASPKQEVGRLPTVDGWTLTDVGYGGALIENRRGTFEVYAGDFVPGLGRIEAIRKQDGHWVVVTGKGLIVSR
jgi:hypothetical protein